MKRLFYSVFLGIFAGFFLEAGASVKVGMAKKPLTVALEAASVVLPFEFLFLFGQDKLFRDVEKTINKNSTKTISSDDYFVAEDPARNRKEPSNLSLTKIHTIFGEQGIKVHFPTLSSDLSLKNILNESKLEGKSKDTCWIDFFNVSVISSKGDKVLFFAKEGGKKNFLPPISSDTWGAILKHERGHVLARHVEKQCLLEGFLKTIGLMTSYKAASLAGAACETTALAPDLLLHGGTIAAGTVTLYLFVKIRLFLGALYRNICECEADAHVAKYGTNEELRSLIQLFKSFKERKKPVHLARQRLCRKCVELGCCRVTTFEKEQMKYGEFSHLSYPTEDKRIASMEEELERRKAK